MRFDLPEGWVAASLVQVCELNPPKPPPDLLPPDSDVTFAPMPAVDADSGTLAAPQLRPFAKVRNGHPSFRDGDVIFEKITRCMENGKAAVVRGLKNGIRFGSTEFHVLRPTLAVLADYIYHFIRQESFREAAAAEMTGSVGQKRVPADFLIHVVLPLPPLPEQQRIVAKVEALLARVNSARQRLAKVPAILKRFRPSVLAAACSGALTADSREAQTVLETGESLLARIRMERQKLALGARNRGRSDSDEDEDPTSDPFAVKWDTPESWAWAPIRELLSYDRSAAYGVLQPGKDIPSGVLFVRVCDLVGGTADTSEIRRIDPAIDRQIPQPIFKATRSLSSSLERLAD
jgi:type I restriction enzyme S subunit